MGGYMKFQGGRPDACPPATPPGAPVRVRAHSPAVALERPAQGQASSTDYVDPLD